MKPQFTFYFTDQPQFRTTDKRYITANMLRAYRAHPERYRLKRLGLHRYSVTTDPWRDNVVAAILEIV
jgi:hypothetical protein